ncbi:MAG TPA: DUF1080 domain-containing protein [Prolixibacteraceae bacterium]
MRKTLFLVAFMLPLLLVAKSKEEKLFNGKNLNNWEIYIGAASGKPTEPLFTVVKVNGENLLRITGEVNASLATKKEYENYHLKMVFRWGEKVFKQKNSGILYHSFGPFGEGLGVWMSAHEFQLCTGKMGDSYCMGNSYFEIPAVKDPDGKNFRYSADGTKSQFGGTFPAKNCAKKSDQEKHAGEWNVVDLWCFGRNSVHVVNGVVNMVNYNSGSIDKDGKIQPLSDGRIQIQSEGGELFIKSITLEKIGQIPPELLK